MKMDNKYSPISNKLNTILPNELKKYLKSNESIIVYFGRPSCSDCNLFEKSFIKYIDQYNLSSKIYYVNVNTIHDNKNEWTAFKKQYGISGTPTFVKYKYDIEVNKLDFEEDNGFSSTDLKEWLKINQLI